MGVLKTLKHKKGSEINPVVDHRYMVNIVTSIVTYHFLRSGAHLPKQVQLLTLPRKLLLFFLGGTR